MSAGLRPSEGAWHAASVVVCTRDRGSSVVETVLSILKTSDVPIQLVIVDQSSSTDTYRALRQLLHDERIVYFRSSETGLGRARNAGLEISQHEIVLFTDDDVTVPPNWVSVMSRIMLDNPSVAVAFCNVDAAPHDAARGFVPAYVRQSDALVSSLWQKCTARGIGAGMAVRRTAVVGIGGFDVLLGAGGRFSSCEDGDIAVRALLNGWNVYESSEVGVVHFGYRTWDEGRELTKRDWYGIGAAYSKPLRCRRWNILPVIVYELLYKAVWCAFTPIVRFQRPIGVKRGWYFVRGLVAGLRTPVNCRTLLFRDE